MTDRLAVGFQCPVLTILTLVEGGAGARLLPGRTQDQGSLTPRLEILVYMTKRRRLALLVGWQ